MSRPLALVTGGTRGIGLGIAKALAARGWRLALCGLRDAADVRPVLDELESGGTDVHYFRADVGSAGDRAALVEDVYARAGRLHALVNNAGRGVRVRADLIDATEASFEEVLRTNLQGPYFLTQAVAARMIADRLADPDRRSSIVFITSVSADMASVNRGEYCVSKAGLAMAVKLFATRLAPEGIPVFEVRPGIIATDMTAGVKDLYDQRIAGGLVPAHRWGTPDDVGRLVAALADGDLGYATGSVISVDGGLGIQRL